MRSIKQCTPRTVDLSKPLFWHAKPAQPYQINTHKMCSIPVDNREVWQILCANRASPNHNRLANVHVLVNASETTDYGTVPYRDVARNSCTVCKLRM